MVLWHMVGYLARFEGHRKKEGTNSISHAMDTFLNIKQATYMKVV